MNYIYLLYLYKLAESELDRDIKSFIYFDTYKELEQKIKSIEVKDADNKGNVKIKISASTIQRMIKSTEYKDFFCIDKGGFSKNTIILQNNFRSGRNRQMPFVVLCPTTYNLLIQQQDNLLAQYTIYMKYMCGLCGNKGTDFTANQFLQTFEYATNSNNYKDKISKYNSLLEEKKIVSIHRNSLEQGKRRNTYIFLDQ